MESITLPAHFDGEHIRLDVPFDLKPSTRLTVTILLEEEADRERANWLSLSSDGLKKAYSEAEPDYTSVEIKEANQDYEGS